MAYLFYFFVSVAVFGPAYFLWTFWRDARKRNWNYTTESTRAMYVDIAKTMVTASGIAVALVASSASPLRAVDSIVRFCSRAGVVSLVLCLCTSLVTMISLTRNNERAVSRNLEAGKSGREGQLTNVELAFTLISAWLALSSFLVGALFLGRITFHV
jgi:hypothetical protein